MESPPPLIPEIYVDDNDIASKLRSFSREKGSSFPCFPPPFFFLSDSP